MSKPLWTSRIVFPGGTVIAPDIVRIVSPYYDYIDFDLECEFGEGHEHWPLDGSERFDDATGFSDSEQTPIFENDLLDFTNPYMTNSDGSLETLHGVVEWDKARGMWVIRRNAAWIVPLFKYAKTSKVTERKAEIPTDAQERTQD